MSENPGKSECMNQLLSSDEDGQINAICAEIRQLLDKAVHRCITNQKMGIMLSGGLDASVIAALASKYTHLTAYTVALKGAYAPDIEASSIVTNTFGIRHRIHYIDEDQLQELMPPVIKILKTFDPIELRNSIALYAGMLEAKEDGIEVLLTGDGSDELMVGYNFIIDMKKEALESRLRKMWSFMAFSAVPLAAALGITTKIPYLDPDFKAYAMSLDIKYKVRNRGCIIFGKWILRKAFEGILPNEIAWRTKAPVQCGSGTISLPEYFAAKISDEDFAKKKEYYLKNDKVRVDTKEQLAYYEVFRVVNGVPRKPRFAASCPQCNSELSPLVDYCHTCGAGLKLSLQGSRYPTK